VLLSTFFPTPIENNEGLLDVIKDTLMAITCNKDECDWFVNVALLKRILRTSGASDLSSVTNNIDLLFKISRDCPEHIQRFRQSEACPFASIASAFKNLSWKEDVLRKSMNMFLESIALFVRYVTRNSKADQCSSVLESIADTLCSVVTGDNETVSGAVASSMESFLSKLSPEVSANNLELFRHTYRCDVCRVCPITGKHWRCCDCDDCFDLCDKCHSKCTVFPGNHLPSHRMIVHDDGRIISCVICGFSKLATSWFACSSCNAIICSECAKSSSCNSQHCPGSTLNPVTSEQQPPVSFLKSLLQNMTSDYLVAGDLTDEMKRYLRESDKTIKFVPGCAITREYDPEKEVAHKASDSNAKPESLFLKAACVKLLQFAQNVDKGTISPRALIPILQTLHAICVELYVTSKDLSLLAPLADLFAQVHEKIATVLESENNTGKFIILFLLLEKALYDSLWKKAFNDKASVESLTALVQRTINPDILGRFQKLIREDCFRSGNRPVPMAVDDDSKQEASPQQILASILKPTTNVKTFAVSVEPLLASEYSAQHPDIFEDYFEVLALTLLDLLSALLRISKPAGMYDMWKDTIVFALGVQSSKYVHTAVKNLARLICTDDVIYRMVRDGNMLDTEIKWLESEAECSHNFTVPMSSSESARVIDHLSVLTKLSNKREAVWKAYCSEHPSIYKLLYVILTSICSVSADSVPADLIIAFLSLLSAGVSSGNVEDKEVGKVASVRPSKAEIEFVLFMESDAKKLYQFAELFALHYGDANVRTYASVLLKRVWFLADSSESKRVLMDLFSCLLQKAPSVGVQSKEFMNELGEMFDSKKAVDEQESEMVVDPKMLVSMLRSQNRVLMEHPNASLYTRLGGLVEDLSQYLFEPRPCMICNAASTECKLVDLGDITKQMRATSTARFYSLKNTYIIKSLSLSVQKRRDSSRTAKVVNIYVNTRRVADIIDLRDKWDMWKRVQSIRLQEDSREAVIAFPHPVSAANLCMEVAELHSSGREALKCPRCGNSVPDRHGICSHCGENAYQCRGCRYIPYENFDAFFCPQCGNCRDCQLEVTLSVYESFVPEPVESDEDLKKATESLSSHASSATDALLRLYDLRTSASSFLYP